MPQTVTPATVPGTPYDKMTVSSCAKAHNAPMSKDLKQFKTVIVKNDDRIFYSINHIIFVFHQSILYKKFHPNLSGVSSRQICLYGHPTARSHSCHFRLGVNLQDMPHPGYILKKKKKCKNRTYSIFQFKNGSH